MRIRLVGVHAYCPIAGVCSAKQLRCKAHRDIVSKSAALSFEPSPDSSEASREGACTRTLKNSNSETSFVAKKRTGEFRALERRQTATMSPMPCIWLAFIGANALRVPLPHLRARRLSRAIKPLHSPLSSSTSVLYASGTTPDAAVIEPEPEKRGLKAILASPETKKVVPLALIFFCILFNYTILRDTKDVLVVTAPKSGAEIIPFLKTYVNLPGAIAFTVLYGSLSNRFSQPQVFRGVVSTFLGFFAAFAWVLYPNIGSLHPHGLADAAQKILPGSFQAPIAVIRNWTFSLFYLAAELWGSVVASLLFWGFANSVSGGVPCSRHRRGGGARVG